jgi:hypothetical protein
VLIALGCWVATIATTALILHLTGADELSWGIAAASRYGSGTEISMPIPAPATMPFAAVLCAVPVVVAVRSWRRGRAALAAGEQVDTRRGWNAGGFAVVLAISVISCFAASGYRAPEGLWVAAEFSPILAVLAVGAGWLLHAWIADLRDPEARRRRRDSERGRARAMSRRAARAARRAETPRSQ